MSLRKTQTRYDWLKANTELVGHTPNGMPIYRMVFIGAGETFDDAIDRARHSSKAKEKEDVHKM